MYNLYLSFRNVHVGYCVWQCLAKYSR